MGPPREKWAVIVAVEIARESERQASAQEESGAGLIQTQRMQSISVGRKGNRVGRKSQRKQKKWVMGSAGLLVSSRGPRR